MASLPRLTPMLTAVPPDSTPTLRVGTSEVLVPTLVQMPHGEVVYALGPADFRLLDNGVPQALHVDDDLDTARDVDQQMSVPLYVIVYDHDGHHVKTIFLVYGNPANNPGNERVRVPIRIGDVAIDYRNSTGSVTLVTKSIYNAKLPADLFTLSGMVSTGH